MAFALSPDLTTTDTEDGMILLDQRTGRYWMLNRTGATTLRMVLAGQQPEAIAAELTSGCPDNAPRALGDVNTLLDSLREARLVVTS
jgi:hypothetical protein